MHTTVLISSSILVYELDIVALFLNTLYSCLWGEHLDAILQNSFEQFSWMCDMEFN